MLSRIRSKCLDTGKTVYSRSSTSVICTYVCKKKNPNSIVIPSSCRSSRTPTLRIECSKPCKKLRFLQTKKSVVRVYECEHHWRNLWGYLEFQTWARSYPEYWSKYRCKYMSFCNVWGKNYCRSFFSLSNQEGLLQWSEICRKVWPMTLD